MLGGHDSSDLWTASIVSVVFYGLGLLGTSWIVACGVWAAMLVILQLRYRRALKRLWLSGKDP